VSTSNPYAPQRDAGRDRLPEEQELAGRGMRLLAWFLDGVIASLMIWVPALIVAAVTRVFSQPSDEFDPSLLILPLSLWAVGFIAWAWITLLLVARYGQTMAKRLLEIRVVRSDGSQASLGRIFWLRNVVNGLLKVIPFYALVDVLFIFGERRQTIHDLVADTIVVKA
jgi:uncharacterized RDD family membrane protein YckC